MFKKLLQDFKAFLKTKKFLLFLLCLLLPLIITLFLNTDPFFATVQNFKISVINGHLFWFLITYLPSLLMLNLFLSSKSSFLQYNISFILLSVLLFMPFMFIALAYVCALFGRCL